MSEKWLLIYPDGNGEIVICDPFNSEKELIEHVQEVEYRCKSKRLIELGQEIEEYDFDLTDTHAYVIRPDHNWHELSYSDVLLAHLKSVDSATTITTRIGNTISDPSYTISPDKRAES